MKKIALIVSLMVADLTAAKTQAKYCGAATLISFIATVYCTHKWKSSPEYLAFIDLKNEMKDAGIVVTDIDTMYWHPYVTIWTKSSRYSLFTNMSYFEFRNWIDQYEVARDNTENLWKATAHFMSAGMAISFLLMCIYLLEEEPLSVHI